MAKLAYYASRIAPDKPHQLETAEGYRIYLGVPICRTGFQEYLGKEIKQHPDYDPAWNIADDQVVKIFRPADVVTAPETVASFEGKSVLDGHPPDDVALVLVENESEYGRGHMQNLRVGQPLTEGEAAGETPLVADLFVKNQPLNDKIDGGVRDVSCGYVYSLIRQADGNLAMTKICGNHVAVVPTGRAGPEVSIRDEKPAAIAAGKPANHKEKKRPMSLKHNPLFGRMLKAFAKDAEPEEVAEAAKMAGDAEEKPAVGELHPDIKRHIEDTKTGLDAMKTSMDAISQHLGVGKEKEEEEVVDPAAADATVLEMDPAEQGATDLPKQIAAADSREALVALRSQVVAAKDAAITKTYNARVREVKSAAAAQDSVYTQLAATGTPHDAQIENLDPREFFNGVPYAEGLRRYNEALASKKGK